MDLADTQRFKELEKENVELKKTLAEARRKNRVLEEVNAKNGKPGAKEASRCLYGHPGVMLGASGVSLFRFTSIDLPLSHPTAASSPSSITGAHCRPILAVSTYGYRRIRAVLAREG